MPWHRVRDEPDTIDEVHRRIIKAVQVITDLSGEEIEAMIDDELYVVGIGWWKVNSKVQEEIKAATKSDFMALCASE